MKLLKEMNKKESGQALILALILLLLGGLIIAPLLAFMSTGLRAGQMYEGKMDEVYADDAGIEDAIYNIITPTAPYYADLQDLDEGTSTTYQLTDVNGYSVDVTVTKLSLVQGLLGESEYKIGQPHSGWMHMDVPPELKRLGTDIIDEEERDYVEYTVCVSIIYVPEEGEGQQTRQIETVGAYFARTPSDESLVDGPYDYDIGLTGLELPWDLTPWGAMHFDDLQEGSPETKFIAGDFGFIWRWEKNKGPEFSPDDEGRFIFRFKIYDETTWEPLLSFVWSTFRQQDVSYATSDIDLGKWLIEATAGDTEVMSAVLGKVGTANILTWEINPPE